MSKIFESIKVRNLIKRQPIAKKPKLEPNSRPKVAIASLAEEPKLEEQKVDVVEEPKEIKEVAPENRPRVVIASAIKRAYNKTYYQKHMEEHKAKHKIKVACELCGKVVNKQNLSAHKGRSRCRNRQEILKFQKDLIKQYPLPKRTNVEKHSFINYEHIQRGLDLIDLISKSFKK